MAISLNTSTLARMQALIDGAVPQTSVEAYRLSNYLRGKELALASLESGAFSEAQYQQAIAFALRHAALGHVAPTASEGARTEAVPA